MAESRPLTFDAMTLPPLVAAEQIVKRFGALTANDHVDLAVNPAKSTRFWGRTGPASRRW